MTVVLLFSSFLCLVNGKGGFCNPVDIENDKYQNDPTEELDFECPSGYALYKVQSCFDEFNDKRKRSGGPDDRLWLWECRAVSHKSLQ